VRDLLVITPSRGRPGRLQEMLAACLSLSGAATDVAVAVDDDQALLYAGTVPGNCQGRVRMFTGPRDTLTGWTNKLASRHSGRYRAFASLGDDHLPRTGNWDGLLLAALGRTGGTGIAYGNDMIMGGRLPTAPVISAGIVEALGWMCEPSMRHMCVDLCWRDIGELSGCLSYVPDVVIEHMHWGVAKSALDATYADAEALHQDDRDAYARWRDDRMAADTAKVRALVRHCLPDCDRLDGHDGRDAGGCMAGGAVLPPGAPMPPWCGQDAGVVASLPAGSGT